LKENEEIRLPTRPKKKIDRIKIKRWSAQVTLRAENGGRKKTRRARQTKEIRGRTLFHASERAHTLPHPSQMNK
jgi:hypothetical protein